MAEIVGVAAAVLQLTNVIGGAVKLIREYKDAGKQYNKNVDELHSKLQTFEVSLESLDATTKRIESLGPLKQSDSIELLCMQKGLIKCSEGLQALFGHEDALRQRGCDSISRRVLRDWFYKNGGEDEVDRAVRVIIDRMDSIKTALTSLNTRVTCDIYKLICQLLDFLSPTRADSYDPTVSPVPTISPAPTLSPVSTSGTLCEAVTNRSNLNSPINEKSVSHLSDDMISAIKDKKSEDVARLLKSGENPLDEDAEGLCAFHHAVEAGDKMVMRQLLGSKQAKGEGGLEQRNRDGATPLHFASSKGFISMAKELLEAGADKNAEDHHHRSPLFVAVERSKSEIFDLLLGQGAKCTPSQFTPPHLDRFKRMRNDFLDRQSISAKKKKR